MSFALLAPSDDRAEPLEHSPDLLRSGGATEPDGPDEQSACVAQRISALGEMTGGIAHDLRNILAVIETGLRLAEGNFDDAAKRRACFAAAHEGVSRGMRMTSRLLTFAKRQELEPGLHNVNDLLGDLEMFLAYAAGPGIRLCFELADDLPPCLVDPPRFNAAILNLVVNARDAMPSGGAIEISTAAVFEHAGTSAEDEARFVRLRVKDDGHGMRPEVVRRIFDPYFTTKGESGTGLGVPQVSALMRLVGGYVRVDSAVGAGTTFDLFFPDDGLPGGGAGTAAERRRQTMERGINGRLG